MIGPILGAITFIAITVIICITINIIDKRKYKNADILIYKIEQYIKELESDDYKYGESHPITKREVLSRLKIIIRL